MRFTYLVPLSCAVCVFACAEPVTSPTISDRAPALNAKAPPKPTFQVVTTKVNDRDGSGALLATRADDHDAVGFATYTESNGVVSDISIDNGAWQLLLANQTTRTLHLAITDAGFPVPDGYYYDKIEVYDRCFDGNNVGTSLLSMAGGESNSNCTFGLDVQYGKTKYKLVMGAQYSGTGRAQVTCTSSAGVACSSWTIVTAANVANAGIANLYRYSSNGSLVAAGSFHNSYSIELTKN